MRRGAEGATTCDIVRGAECSHAGDAQAQLKSRSHQSTFALCRTFRTFCTAPHLSHLSHVSHRAHLVSFLLQNDPPDRDRANFSSTMLSQHVGARLQRRASRRQVVYQHACAPVNAPHPAGAMPRRPPGDGKRRTDVFVPCVSIELELWRRRATAPDRWPDRQAACAQGASEIGRLIEAAAPLDARDEAGRESARRRRRRVSSTDERSRDAERYGERAAPIELERVQQIPQHAFIWSERAERTRAQSERRGTRAPRPAVVTARRIARTTAGRSIGGSASSGHTPATASATREPSGKRCTAARTPPKSARRQRTAAFLISITRSRNACVFPKALSG